MTRYKPKPGPAEPFAIVLATYRGITSVVAISAPHAASRAIDEVKQARPNLAICTFSVDQIEREGRLR